MQQKAHVIKLLPKAAKFDEAPNKSKKYNIYNSPKQKLGFRQAMGDG